jgi:hypothetical protein
MLWRQDGQSGTPGFKQSLPPRCTAGARTGSTPYRQRRTPRARTQTYSCQMCATTGDETVLWRLRGRPSAGRRELLYSRLPWCVATTPPPARCGAPRWRVAACVSTRAVLMLLSLCMCGGGVPRRRSTASVLRRAHNPFGRTTFRGFCDVSTRCPRVAAALRPLVYIACECLRAVVVRGHYCPGG